MTTVAIPELALSAACLVTISRHIDGVYTAHVYDGEVSMQGYAEDVAHIVTDLGLTHDPDGGSVTPTHRYQIFKGHGPGEFASVEIRLVAVHKVAA